MQGRYKAILVERDSYLLELCRYVVLNPVRARIVRPARDYRWSSYRATAGLRATPELLCTQWILAHFGEERSAAQRRYRRFVTEGVGRSTPWAKVRGQLFLGQEGFSVMPLRHGIGTPNQPTYRQLQAGIARLLRSSPSAVHLATGIRLGVETVTVYTRQVMMARQPRWLSVAIYTTGPRVGRLATALEPTVAQRMRHGLR